MANASYTPLTEQQGLQNAETPFISPEGQKSGDDNAAISPLGRRRSEPLVRVELPKEECPCIINPEKSKFMAVWDLVMAAALIVTAVLVPFEVAFIEVKLDAWFVFDRCLDCVFITDMCTQFLLMYPDPDRPTRMIKKPRLIATRYLSGWFWIDIMSISPVDIISVTTKVKSGAMRSMKLVRCLRLVRLLRLARFQRIMDRWQSSFGFSYSMISLMSLSSTGFLCCHWIACLWGGMALHGETPGEPTWLTVALVAKGESGHVSDLADDKVKMVYLLSLYWTVTTITSIGYGDITPQNEHEITVAMIAMIIMVCLNFTV
eukprot:gnl/TRDRNA2_/TRDRNA2_146166_c1_seq2.p1 gnl/TRDRNA2_/TRDRNA2_146166_c1~~gnl/TRDRNA2_/TRDRNA2_146166_c1_seq2.p1  ORF type:complete len:318 (+),score=29.86 gnl/TRDRNA2_/TRDRNA2_146166_c1_seq2:54-1007(+)